MSEGTLTPERPQVRVIGREPSIQDLQRREREEFQQKGYQEVPKKAKEAFELKRDLHRVEEELKKLTPESRMATEGKGEAPGIILRKEKNWSRFGWGVDPEEVRAEPDPEKKTKIKSKKEKVQERLSQLFAGEPERPEDRAAWQEFRREFRMSEQQIQTIMELMVASGQKPEDLLVQLQEKNILEKGKDESRMQQLRSADPRLLFFTQLGIPLDHLQRFVFFEDFHGEIDRDFQADPDNSEELAWQMMHYRNVDKWRSTGDFPLLEMRVVMKKDKDGRETGEVDADKSDYYLNQANMISWIRDYMWQLHDANPKEMQNFFGEVSIKKQLGAVSMMDMYLQKDRYLKSKDGKTIYDELSLQVLLEGVMFLQAKKSDVELRPVLADLDGLTKKILEQFDRSPFTADLGPGNLLFFMMSAPLEFKSTPEGELAVSDGIMGSIWNHLNLAYRNLSNIEGLQDVLGADSSFFTKQGMWNAMQAGWKSRQGFTGDVDPRSFLPQGKYKLFESAFYPMAGEPGAEDVPRELQGKIKNQEAFKQLINFFKERTPNDNHIRMVRAALIASMAELYGQEDPNKPGSYALYNSEGKEDETALKIAEVWSYSWNLITGTAVLNAEGIPAFNAMLKPMEAGAYWRKYSDYRGGLGNPLNAFWMKRFAGTFLEELPVTDTVPVTELVHKKDARGRFLYEMEPEYQTKKDDKGNVVPVFAKDSEGKWVKKPKHDIRGKVKLKYKRDARGEKVPVMVERETKEQRRMSLLDVMQQHQKVNMEQRNYIRQLRNQLKRIDPNDPTKQKERTYLEGRLHRATDQAARMIHQVATRLEFSQDAQNQWAVDQWERSVHLYKLFEGAKEIKFQDFVSMTPYGSQFDKEKFIQAFVKEVATPTRYWATAGLGDLTQLVERKVWDPRLKKEVFKKIPMGEAKLGYQVLNRKEFWKKKENGMWDYDDEGKHVIDYAKIENGEGERAGKKLLWKNVILMKLAADLKSHLSIHMSDPQFTLDQKMKMVQTIKEISGPYVGDDKDINSVKMIDRFYSKKDIRWAMDVAGAHYYNFAWQEFWGLFLPKHDKQDKSMVNSFFAAVFR